MADWPIGYADLEPYYAAVEQAIGVAGDHAANPFAAWRSGPTRCRRVPTCSGATLSVPAAERLGCTYRAPTGANSVPDGRPCLQRLRVLRLLRLPDPRQGRPHRDAGTRLAIGRCDLPLSPT